LTTPEQSQPSTPKELPGAMAFAALGMTIACTVGAFVALGIWADSSFGTSPLCLVIGLVLGCLAATATTVSLVRRYL
jgi:F0F1-type ATP synthase assembly protein I